MKFLKRKQKRGPYRVRTAKQRAEELLEKAWLRDLSEHPEYAREVARQRYGTFGESSDEHYESPPPPDLLETLETAKRAKELLAEEVGEEKKGIIHYIPEIMKAFPSLVEGLKNMQSMAQPGAPPPPQVEQPQAKQLEPSRERRLIDFANRITEMKPEEAAQELYQNRGKEGDVRSIIYNTLLGNTLDDVMALVPILETMPDYEFLQPFVVKLTAPKGRQWVSLVIDECNRLNLQDSTPEKETEQFTPG